MKLYRDFGSQEEIDAEYNIGASMPGWESWLERFADDSEAARQSLDCALDVPYGPTLDEHLDIFPSPRAASPVLVFIHGGYWRALTSKDFSFIARTFVEQGITVAINNYSLCPKASIAEITRQCRAVVAWLSRNAADYNGDPGQIHLAGHSAGGHLTAMVCSTDWPGEYGLPEDIVRGGLAISGVFDLEPLRYSYLQPVLMLTDEVVRRHSPSLTVPEAGPPMVLSVGEKESAEFHRQAQDYRALREAKAMRCAFQVEAAEDHFSILYRLLDRNSPLFESTLDLMDRG